ncbi:Glycosyl transferase family 2 [Catalinimonas alkaloidigena]|uniref:Glycosyl transferase family 2 n=1 Tax=Catalinimonas alkaloidigena TaxID=1075417 RepID=A0A1G8ZL79_9BACT|nr:glycosyltransferase family 2 protein [Catalinimonas alkaloidigena]SDK15155.1 Glycosyl transferase family 2 [Catalinimonas alkaloidigena]
MRLSIITVTYNAERYLERTLQSINRQTRRDAIEHLIIDGRSQDRTLAIIEGYRESIDYISSEPDQGLYDAMNKGIQHASGDFVWFVNAGDELYDHTAAARVLQALETGADIAYGETMLVDEAGQALGLRSQLTPHLLPAQLTWRTLQRGLAVSHQSFIVRRSMAPLYEHQRHFYSADVDWMIKCLKASRHTALAQGILTRFLLGGFSQKNHAKSLLDRFAVLRRHFGLGLTLWNHARIVGRAALFRLGGSRSNRL